MTQGKESQQRDLDDKDKKRETWINAWTQSEERDRYNSLITKLQ